MINQAQLPIIAGIEITTDTQGRFSLNAIHKASELGKNKTPNEWLRTQQAQELISERSFQTGNSRLGQEVLITHRGGNTHSAVKSPKKESNPCQMH